MRRNMPMTIDRGRRQIVPWPHWQFCSISQKDRQAFTPLNNRSFIYSTKELISQPVNNQAIISQLISCFLSFVLLKRRKSEKNNRPYCVMKPIFPALRKVLLRGLFRSKQIFTRDSSKCFARLSHRRGVCPSVRPSHPGTVSKRRYLESQNLHCGLPEGL